MSLPAPGAVGSGPLLRPWSDQYAADLVIGSGIPDLLRVFNQAGVLAPADVHTAVRLGRLAGEEDEQVLLAVALAVRGPRVGHVSVDLADVSASAVVGEDEIDVEGLPWPEVESWSSRVSSSPLVASPEASGSDRPLRFSTTALYLDRYWRDEVYLAADLLARAADRTGWADRTDGSLEADLQRLSPGPESSDQRAALGETVGRRLTVLAGGPGTGKTTTVARLLVLLVEQALVARRRPPQVALAAPTGKAAARMEEAVRAETLRMDTTVEVRDVLSGFSGSTLHRLLGPRPGRPGQFRHHRGHRLPHDVVVVDEASMVSLSLMTRLVEAVRPDAQLILVGDPEQLVSVEAGAVLADIVAPAATMSHVAPAATMGPAKAQRPSTHVEPNPMARSISLLRTNHRFSGSLARLSEAVRAGDPDAAVAALSAEDGAVRWDDTDPSPSDGPLGGSSGEPPTWLPGSLLGWARAVQEAAAAGEAGAALSALRSQRVLCAHRRGPAGAAAWNLAIERWLRGDASDAAERSWYPGRPVLVTANDYSQRLFNGDTGVTVAAPSPDPEGRSTLRVVFDGRSGDGWLEFSPSRLDSVETVFAMTVHKSQGSEFDHVTLLMPDARSRLLTRELLYTAVTRARRSILVVGTEAAVRAAVVRPIARASGLSARLWEGAGASR